MYPNLFTLPVPSFLQGFLPAELTVHAYGTLIALGALIGFLFLSYQMKRRFSVPMEEAQNLFILLVIGGFVGGKLFFYLEDPSYFFGTPKNMVRNLGSGFVFYGSLLFCIPLVGWFIRRHKIPALQMLDLVGITACIVHVFGRLGCLGAGCCYGLPSEGFFSLVFTDPQCLAKPLGTPLHPTQLYSVLLISTILITLLVVRNYQKFHGQLFLIYLLMYAAGRAVIEEFRGDFKRGYVLNGLLSHSQFISLGVALAAIAFYFWLRKRNQASEGEQ